MELNFDSEMHCEERWQRKRRIHIDRKTFFTRKAFPAQGKLLLKTLGELYAMRLHLVIFNFIYGVWSHDNVPTEGRAQSHH